MKLQKCQNESASVWAVTNGSKQALQIVLTSNWARLKAPTQNLNRNVGQLCSTHEKGGQRLIQGLRKSIVRPAIYDGGAEITRQQNVHLRRKLLP